MTQTAVELSVTCRPFSAEPRGRYRLLVTPERVLVWDSVAGHYTGLHRLSVRTRARIRSQASIAATV